MFNYTINKSAQFNTPQICALEFIPNEFVSAINYTQANKLNVSSILLDALQIATPTAYVWYSGYFFKGSEEIETDTKPTDNGPLHVTDLQFFIPCDDDEHAHTLDRLNEYRFIVKYTDKSGNVKLVGTKENGCIISYKFTNKRGVRGYQIKFILESERPNAYINA